LIKRQSGFDEEVHEELIYLRDKIVAHSDAAYVDARVLVKRLTNFTFERKRGIENLVLGAVVMMNAVHILTDQNLAARMQAHVQSAAEAMITLLEDELEDYGRAGNEFPGIFRTVHSEGTLGRSFNEETVVIPVNAGTVHLPRTVPDPFQVLLRPPLQLGGDGYDYRSTGIGVDLIGSAAVKLDDGSEITILVEQNLFEPTDPNPSD